jgi:hypothetical protein
MSLEKLFTGCVIRYPYLWRHEALSGETEGRKSARPTVVGFRLRLKSGKEQLLLFPITTKDPGSERFSVEIPTSQKKSAGLDPDLQQWIIFEECNADVIGNSFYLLPSKPIGNFSYDFLNPHLMKFIAQRGQMHIVNRSGN